MSDPRIPADQAHVDLVARHLKTMKALQIAVRCLHKFSWEGSSVNFPARTALNEIRALGVDVETLRKEGK